MSKQPTIKRPDNCPLCGASARWLHYGGMELDESRNAKAFPVWHCEKCDSRIVPVCPTCSAPMQYQRARGFYCVYHGPGPVEPIPPLTESELTAGPFNCCVCYSEQSMSEIVGYSDHWTMPHESNYPVYRCSVCGESDVPGCPVCGEPMKFDSETGHKCLIHGWPKKAPVE